MSLLRLPPEILEQIFNYIGSSFFREDLGRLTVCKQWLEFALPAYFKCITLSQETLRNLITSGPCLSSYSQEYAQESNSLNATGLNETWINVVNDDLSQLAILAQQSHKLRTLRIRARRFPPPESLEPPEDYLPMASMQAFLSVGKLSFLELDLSSNFLDSSGQRGDDYHICPAIGALLPTLRTLHLRMRSICPDVLKPRDPNNCLHLSGVVINLSLTMGIMAAAHSKRCGSQGGGLLQLKADIQEQAAAIATRMASPKIIRILTHSLPLFKIQSLDVLTGKTMILDDDMAWDEDGKTVKEESEPESEISGHDEFSTF
ncbi:hypothetical protein PISL3812_05379 [Talaromyces islandicus]|uniref:F-box domain-containing protein n=1 Tax=Talaromyces islandicus TaxID=28573 RepID=A0A0U1LYD7_TALIS|nr:hypothetical protein PISL3812_05379 [Talaromyces islandicus]